MNENPPPPKLEFTGQQSDEIILSTIYPSKLILIWGLFTKLLLMALIFFAWFRISPYVPEKALGVPKYFVYIIIFAVYVIYAKLRFFNFTKIKTYLTDRRIVKFDPTVTFSVQRRTLLWREVSKVREEETELWAIFQVGHVEIFSHESETAADILVPYAKGFEDLASYIDKIVYLVREDPQELNQLPPFEANKKKRQYSS